MDIVTLEQTAFIRIEMFNYRTKVVSLHWVVVRIPNHASKILQHDRNTMFSLQAVFKMQAWKNIPQTSWTLGGRNKEQQEEQEIALPQTKAMSLLFFKTCIFISLTAHSTICDSQLMKVWWSLVYVFWLRDCCALIETLFRPRYHCTWCSQPQYYHRFYSAWTFYHFI